MTCETLYSALCERSVILTKRMQITRTHRAQTLLALATLAVGLSGCTPVTQPPVTTPEPSPVPPQAQLTPLTASDLKDGYANKTLYTPGEIVKLYLNPVKDLKNVSVPLSDSSGQTVLNIPVTEVNSQAVVNAKPYENGFGYMKFVEFKLPETLPSDVYTIFGKVVIPVRSRDTVPLAVLPISTLQAYNCAGGKNLYIDCESKNADDRARIVSFNRPLLSYANSDAQQFLKWAKSQAVPLSLTTDRDLSAEDFKGRKLVVLFGHSEYWSKTSRELFDDFIKRGGNAVIFSGNTMWWQVRHADGKLVCYKSAVEDPETNPELKTINWIEPSLKYSNLDSIGVTFEYGGYSQKDSSYRGYKVLVKDHAIFKGLDLSDDVIHFAPGGGIEYDGAPVTYQANPESIQVKPSFAAQFYKYQLLAFDKGYRKFPTFLTLVDFQRTATSGRVINFSMNAFGYALNMGNDRQRLSSVTRNAFNLLNK